MFLHTHAYHIYLHIVDQARCLWASEVGRIDPDPGVRCKGFNTSGLQHLLSDFLIGQARTVFSLWILRSIKAVIAVIVFTGIYLNPLICLYNFQLSAHHMLMIEDTIKLKEFIHWACEADSRIQCYSYVTVFSLIVVKKQPDWLWVSNRMSNTIV